MSVEVNLESQPTAYPVMSGVPLAPDHENVVHLMVSELQDQSYRRTVFLFSHSSLRRHTSITSHPKVVKDQSGFEGKLAHFLSDAAN
ncbi:MAG: hypothetical protein ACRER2_04195, partial [Methylococcales bacterium]